MRLSDFDLGIADTDHFVTHCLEHPPGDLIAEAKVTTFPAKRRPDAIVVWCYSSLEMAREDDMPNRRPKSSILGSIGSPLLRTR